MLGCLRNARNYTSLIRNEAAANAELCKELLSMMPVNTSSDTNAMEDGRSITNFQIGGSECEVLDSNVVSVAGDSSYLLNSIEEEGFDQTNVVNSQDANNNMLGLVGEESSIFSANTLETSNTDAVSALEAVARGFITRERLKQMEVSQGGINGILLATLGTNQGTVLCAY